MSLTRSDVLSLCGVLGMIVVVAVAVLAVCLAAREDAYWGTVVCVDGDCSSSGSSAPRR